MSMVLLADDDAITSHALARILEKAGHTVRVCTSSIDAWVAVYDEPDTLISDIVFPQGQPHGLALAAHARAVRSRIKVIFITGHSESAAGFLDDECVLTKPVDPEALLALMECEVAAG